MKRERTNRDLITEKSMMYIGIPIHNYGYRNLCDAIVIAAEHKEVLHAVTKELYPEVAKIYGVSSLSVERCIRSAINSAWNNSDSNIRTYLPSITMGQLSSRPTNLQFIAAMAWKVSLDYQDF
jgi:Sporulation initiation factor Spo0A C terminal.